MTTSFFIIFELNDETLIMHTNTLYFSNMKCTMANAQVNLSFLENGRGGFYPSHTEYKFSVRTRYNQGTYCKIFYVVYFSTIILLLWYWIMDDLNKNIFKKSLFCGTKGLLHGEIILVQYTYNGKNKNKS